MTEEKQQMLSDLYTLRAGLSLISQYGDVVRANERIIENTVEDNDFTKFVKSGNNDYGYAHSIYKYRIEGSSRSEKYYDKFFEQIKDDGLLDREINSKSEEANKSLFKSLGLDIVDKYKRNRAREERERAREDLEQLQKFKSVKDDLIRQHAAWLAKDEKSNYKNQNAAIAKMKNSQLEITCQKPKIQAVFTALDEAFSEQLDKRDWGNVDMIIYFLETNRADSRKEALQLVDRERQTQDIVRAVNNSINWLGNVIKQESQRICSIVGAGFTLLNDRLNDIAKLQCAQMQMQAQQMQVQAQMQARQIQTMQRQISQTEFTNALLQKSNESSQKMMDDFYLMKQKYNL